MRSLDIQILFLIVDVNIIAIGVKINSFLFITFRGTRFLFDWRINFQSNLKKLTFSKKNDYVWFFDHNFSLSVDTYEEFHCGFTEESYRISLLIKNEITKKEQSDIKHIFLCGHSLGGAVAAISEKLLRTTINELFTDECKVSTYIYGSPRYSDISSYISSPYPPAIQIRRLGDMVPFVPLKKMGYTDHPYSFNTNGKTDKYKLNDRWLPYMWFPFFIKKVEPHSMESYRKELAKTAEVDALDLPLIPLEKLSKIDSSDKE